MTNADIVRRFETEFKDRSNFDIVVTQGDLVADRISATGRRTDNGERAEWVENHIYRVRDGRICALWPAGGPTLY